MVKNLFVGGLPYETTQEELKALFATCGTVVHAKVIIDRETNRSKGFGFIEMSTEAEAQAAINKLNGAQVGQRKIFVNEARPMEKRAPGAPPPGGPRPGGFGGSRPSFDKPSFGGGDRPPFGGGKPSFGDGKGGGRGGRGGRGGGKGGDFGGMPDFGGEGKPGRKERGGKRGKRDDQFDDDGDQRWR